MNNREGGTMLAHEVLRSAAEWFDNGGGWSQGAAARGADGAEVPLYSGTGGGTSRAGINPAATALSMYGAIAKVLLVSGGGAVDAAMMWAELTRLAMERGTPPTGGNNYFHPIIGFNEAPDRTRAEVVALLRAAAATLDPEKSEPAPPAIETTGG